MTELTGLKAEFIKDYRQIMAEIIYHMPDNPQFLQTFIWHEMDIAPRYPVLHNFLDFWQRNLDGKLHSVYVDSQRLITPGEYKYAQTQFTLQ